VFIHTANFYPTVGKVGDLRAILEEQVRDRQQRGYRTSASSTMYGPDYPAVHLSWLVDDLAAIEKGRAELRETTVEYACCASAYVRALTMLGLWEVLVRMTPTDAPVRFGWRNARSWTGGRASALRCSCRSPAPQPAVLSCTAGTRVSRRFSRSERVCRRIPRTLRG